MAGRHDATHFHQELFGIKWNEKPKPKQKCTAELYLDTNKYLKC